LKKAYRSLVGDVLDGEITSPGELVKRARLEMDLSQKELARILKVSQSFLSKVENDRLEINVKEWFRFCELTEIPFEIYTYFVK
jgi:transcriptional regulator with XRE-family HTH domain